MYWIVTALLVAFCLPDFIACAYYGKFIQEFTTLAHGVQGKVYAANENTFYLVDFSYDGQGPDAFFWSGTTDSPSTEGFIVPDEKGSTEVLGKYNNQNLVITLPDGKSIKDIKWLSVWCRSFEVNFGNIMIPTDLDLPKERVIGNIPTFGHQVSSGPVIIKDAKTIFITQLHYDGAAPDAFFLVGNGSKPTSKGAVKVPDEMGRLEKLMGYTGKDITLHLPDGLTVFNFEWLALYCIQFEENFGHVTIPTDLNVPANIEKIKMPSKKKRVSSQAPYYGKKIGDFITQAHDVKGTVYAASEDTFYLVGFSYDGQGPDAYFWAGSSTNQPSPGGFIVPDEFGTRQVLGKYTNQNIAITLPDGMKIKDIKWLSVWCRKFAANFGYIMIPSNFEAPKEVDLGPIPTLAHSTSAKSVIIKDAKTLYITDLNYDGAGPDAFFLVGKGSSPHSKGEKVPDENGSLQKLKGYQGKNIMLRLPSDLTVFDIEWFGLYCIQFNQNFGHVMIPKVLNVPADIQSRLLMSSNFENCEEIFPNVLQVRWKILDDHLYVNMDGRLEENEYMAFGRSGSDSEAKMEGSDVAIAFYDNDDREVKVIDYFITSKSQCSLTSGVCPDSKLGGSQNVELLAWQKANGILKVVYKRPLSGSDSQDQSIPPSGSVVVVAAIGPLNNIKEALYHPVYVTKNTINIDFGRSNGMNNCKPFTIKQEDSTMSTEKGWEPQKISGETEFRAQIGPTGGDKGYKAITGMPSWGIAWWINGKMIPEITVQRNVNYTFIVEGGQNPAIQARYHPLYITSSPEGGGGQSIGKLPENHKIFAGVTILEDGTVMKHGEGKYCEWKHNTVDKAEESMTFEEYKKTLTLQCDDGGEPGKFFWVPDDNTPNVVYYQCFIHRNMGWKINVVGGNRKAEPQNSESPILIPHLLTAALSCLIALIFLK